ncbi:MAG: glutathione S-transferase N-terminal domain-containing protein [Coleofasciculus chthonoplastes F3-SA18-01]|uniref:glutathione S-transferase N-terminal domain-containing protein n=1 Tax=Coleofasciculus chthonoplastes TaxID=64178 RepID=UPI0032F2FBDD
MITLYTAPSFWGLPSISPPCMKLETWLRMANLPYQTVIVTAQDFAIAPKGKIPFISYKGKLFGDSTLIIEMLKQAEGIDLDASLTRTERFRYKISLFLRQSLRNAARWLPLYDIWRVRLLELESYL